MDGGVVVVSSQSLVRGVNVELSIISTVLELPPVVLSGTSPVVGLSLDGDTVVMITNSFVVGEKVIVISSAPVIVGCIVVLSVGGLEVMFSESPVVGDNIVVNTSKSVVGGVTVVTEPSVVIFPISVGLSLDGVTVANVAESLLAEEVKGYEIVVISSKPDCVSGSLVISGIAVGVTEASLLSDFNGCCVVSASGIVGEGDTVVTESLALTV